MSKRGKFYLGLMAVLALLAAGGGAFFVNANRDAQARRARLEARLGGVVKIAEQIVREAGETQAGSRSTVAVQLPAAVTSAPLARVAEVRPASVAVPMASERRRVHIFSEIAALLSESQELASLDLGMQYGTLCNLGPVADNPAGILSEVDRRKIRKSCQGFVRLETGVNNASWNAVRKARNTATLTGHDLGVHLDRLEALLLDCEWIVPEYQEYQQYALNRFSFYQFALLHQLAVARALARDDGERAARLLVKGVEFYRIQVLYCYPAGVYMMNDLALTIALAGDWPSFPTRGLEDALRVMESMKLSPAQRDALRKAHALRWAAAVGAAPCFGHNDNFIHWIQIRGIGPDRMALMLVWPKFRQFFDDYAEAWEAEDEAGMERAIAGMQRYGWVTNVHPENMRAALDEIDMKRVVANHDLDVDFVRLALAAALERRITGRVAGSVSELVPRFLATLPDWEGGWELTRLEADAQSVKPPGGLDGGAAWTVFVHLDQVRRFEWYNPDMKMTYPAEHPADKRWDFECKERLAHGYHEVGTFRQANIRIFPIRREIWQDVMDLFRQADRERGGAQVKAGNGNNGNAKK